MKAFGRTLKIEFEGTDGAGKTTGLKYFIEKAKEIGLNVVETREVGNPHIPTCVKLREFVLDPANELSGEAMELIFTAMRFENDKWLKNLSLEVDLVLSDRGWLSHLAYTDHNVDTYFTELLYLDLVLEKTLLPDIVIYFNVDSETALNRRVKRGGAIDVIEQKGTAFQDSVRQSFDRYLRGFLGNTYEVDANQDLNQVKVQLDNILSDIMDHYGK